MMVSGGRSPDGNRYTSEWEAADTGEDTDTEDDQEGTD
jgi:hypothetical protein